MGGGLMQLVAYGAQDVYLTGNPQITFWKVVYRRHTNFSMETIEHTLSGNPNFGRKSTATIIRNGDLAYRVYLLVTLDAVSWDVNVPSNGVETSSPCYTPPMLAWVRRLGHALIKSVCVEIGGSEIDEQYGTWLDIWYELTHTDEQDRGYRKMIGDVPELTRLEAPDCNGNVKDEYTLYVPLQFWFNRNSGLALPLIALQYHEVRLDFEFEDVNKLIVWKSDSNGATPNLKDINMKEASILVDYVYLDSVERRRFAQVGHEYLIEQVQFTGDETISGGSPNSRTVSYKSRLSFNHPTKELIWVVKNTTYSGDDLSSSSVSAGNRFLAYSNNEVGWNSVALQDAANNIANNMVRLTSCDPTGQGSLSNLKVTDPVVSLDGVCHCYCLTTNTDGHFIRVNVFVANHEDGDKNLQLNRYPLYSGTLSSSSGAPSGFNFTDCIDEINVNVDQCSGCVSATVVSQQLSLNDVSVPLQSGVAPNNLVDTRYLNNSAGNPFDVYVIQFNNYGLRLDGAGNPVQQAVLQLNGHDRFDPRLGSWFNYVQPWQHHTHTPADGVNVYSFALHPEQHQPSGTCNLSRIDNTVLCLTLEDPLRTSRANCKSNGQLTIDLSNSMLYTYAFNYNVLRIMSGMGGLAYSN